jgi:hypothetical protein
MAARQGQAMIAIVSLTEVVLVAPAAVASVIAYSAGRARSGHGHDSLDRELMRRRRREEPVALLLLEGRCDAATSSALQECLRVTDTVEFRTRRGRVRMRALLDTERLDRDAVERRLASSGAAELAAGWATFPEDGLTLATLLESARDELAPLPTVVAPAREEKVPQARPAEQPAS